MYLRIYFVSFLVIISMLAVCSHRPVTAQSELLENSKLYYSDGITTGNWWRGAGGTACCGCSIKHYGTLPSNFVAGNVKAVTFFLTGSRENSYYETIVTGPTRLRFKLDSKEVEAESRKAYLGETQPLDLPWLIRFEFDDPVYAQPGTPWSLLDGDDEIYSAVILHLSNKKSRENELYALEGISDQNGCQYTYKQTVWYSVRFDFSGDGIHPQKTLKLEIEDLGGTPGSTEFVLKLGGREILHTLGADLSVQENFGLLGNYYVALLSDHTGGNACIAQTYRIVRWKTDGSYWVSDRFGFCTGPEISRKGNTVTFYFKGYPVPRSDIYQPEQTWTYNNGQLTRIE